MSQPYWSEGHLPSGRSSCGSAPRARTRSWNVAVVPADQDAATVIGGLEGVHELGVVVVLVGRLDGQADGLAQRGQGQVRTMAGAGIGRGEEGGELERGDGGIDVVVLEVVHVGVGVGDSRRGEAAAVVGFLGVADDEDRGVGEGGGRGWRGIFVLPVEGRCGEEGEAKPEQRGGNGNEAFHPASVSRGERASSPCRARSRRCWRGCERASIRSGSRFLIAT